MFFSKLQTPTDNRRVSRLCLTVLQLIVLDFPLYSVIHSTVSFCAITSSHEETIASQKCLLPTMASIKTGRKRCLALGSTESSP
ncbi:jg6300 [Pararge aegeria aegeria]|uniref:Jg6300 protein n=1 Tax=Pararge aegeria aegeria TaxID=348720 RepID=A0A8S4RM31_9NEOP|nr:jg6300 [Pararge aegeria aegeria]